MKPYLLTLLCITLTFPALLGQVTSAPAPKREPVIAMCHPTLGQVQNIEEMYEKDIIPVKGLQLIGIYHENEEADYAPAIDYVKSRGLEWIRFRTIKGKVADSDLFRENGWTAQFREIFLQTTGIIFTGGMDVPPALYGQEQDLFTDASTPQRSRFEISFLFHLLGGRANPGWIPFLESRPTYPVLGICLGCQSLNVATGGTLIQDIPSQVYGQKTVEGVLKMDKNAIHSSLYTQRMFPTVAGLAPYFHAIRIQKESIFTRRLGVPASWQPLVLSSHHQAIGALGQNLRPAACSLDGKIIEAIEHARYPHVLGIQFHPEPYALYRKGNKFRPAADQEPTLNLRDMLEADGVSLPFHRLLWKWLGGVI